MAKKIEPKIKKIEREYIIPLRYKGRAVPCYKKTPKAIKTIKEYLVKHMKVKDKDLRKIKIDKYLNEQMWFRGIKKPPVKIKVKAVKEGDVVRVRLVDYPDKLKFKKLREEKKEKAAEEVGKKKKQEKKEKVEDVQTEEEKKENAEKKEEETAPQAYTKEAREPANAGPEKSSTKIFTEGKKVKSNEEGQLREKAAAKQMKHMIGGKKTQKTHPVRKALAK